MTDEALICEARRLASAMPVGPGTWNDEFAVHLIRLARESRAPEPTR